jgi:hypothetical protein
MKKLFFTAIALVAFSGVSMANTIEIENTDSLEKTLQNCFNYALAATVLESGGTPMSQSEFNANYSFYYNACQYAKSVGAEILLPVVIKN